MSFINKKHTEETKRKISEWWKRHGKELDLSRSEETKRKMSKAHIGKRHPESVIEKLRKLNLGLKHSEEAKRKISIANKGRIHTEEERRKMSIANKGRIHSDETKRKISIANKGRILSEEAKRKMSLSRRLYCAEPENLEKLRKLRLGKKHSEETKRKMSIARKKWLSIKENGESNIRKALQNLLKRPTSFEQKLTSLINKYNLPFKYVGDGQFLIGYKNPDFINTDGKKIAVEVYNNFHHPKNYEEIRGRHFSKYGFKTIFVNQDEILSKNWEQICLKKLRGT